MKNSIDFWSPKHQRIWTARQEWKCGRPVRLNSRMKRESNRTFVNATLMALSEILA